MTNHRRLPTRWLPCHRSETATGTSGKQREAARSGDRPPVGLQSHQYTAAHKLLSNHRTPLDHFDTAPGQESRPMVVRQECHAGHDRVHQSAGNPGLQSDT